MLALLLKDKKNLTVEEIDDPIPRNDEALIKIRYAGICGSDLEKYAGRQKVVLPRVLGHEFSGTILAIESRNSTPFNIGDQVVGEPIIGCGECRSCRSGYYNVCNNRKILGAGINGVFAEFVCVPIRNLIKVPENMSLDEASVTQPVAVAVHAIRRTNFSAGNNAAVIGAGPIGSLLAMTARAAGGTKIVLSEPNQFRRELMDSLGFLTIDPSNENPVEKALSILDSDEEGFDIVFDAAGATGTISQAIQMVRVGGEIGLIAKYKEAPQIDTNLAQKREINFLTARAHIFDDFRSALSLIASQQIDVRPIITDKCELHELPTAFNSLLHGGSMMKVLLQANE